MEQLTCKKPVLTVRVLNCPVSATNEIVEINPPVSSVCGRRFPKGYFQAVPNTAPELNADKLAFTDDQLDPSVLENTLALPVKYPKA